MREGSSYRQILRSTSIIGGASVINILMGLIRTKVAAVLLGPAGVGLIGLFQSLMATGAAVSALGFGAVGTRQIAEAAAGEDLGAVATVRRALFWGTLGLAVLGAISFWLLRHVLAEKVLEDASFSGPIGWLALGVGLAVASGSQAALLNGLRRVGDLARISVWSAIVSTVVGAAALWLWGPQGVVAFVLSAPLASFLLGHWYVSKLPRVVGAPSQLSHLASQWKTFAKLGAAFMVAGLVVTAGQLAVRMLVQRKLGVVAVGHFQAASAISMTYIGFVLQAMGTDYYPRLTATIGNFEATNRLVNEQTEVALLLAGPVFVAMLGMAPWVIEVLYSSEFGNAVIVLRWQVLGDILKVASWPLGFILLAAGSGRTYMLCESLATAVFVVAAWIFLPSVGIEATGIAFFLMYVVYLPIVFWLARRKSGFSWERRVALQLLAILGLALVVALAASQSKWLGAALGVVLAIALGINGLAQLAHKADLGGLLGRLAQLSRKMMKRSGVWHE